MSAPFDLSGKTAVVTGGDRGLGLDGPMTDVPARDQRAPGLIPLPTKTPVSSASPLLKRISS